MISKFYCEVSAPNDDGFGCSIVMIPTSFATTFHSDETDIYAAEKRRLLGGTITRETTKNLSEVHGVVHCLATPDLRLLRFWRCGRLTVTHYHDHPIGSPSVHAAAILSTVIRTSPNPHPVSEPCALDQ